MKINSGGTFELHSTNLDVSTDGTVSARNLALSGGSITLDDNGITKFSVTNNGYMTAKSGQIAGWNIGDTTLTGNKTGLAKTTNDTDIAIWAGDTTAANGNFKVTQGGKLYATGAEISGNSTFAGSLNAATGTFGGTVSAGAVVACDISANNIKGGTLTLGGNNNTSGQVTINDASGNQIGSWNNSGISASAGNIGGWYIGQNSLHSGSGQTYVELNSDPTNAYAIWAGNNSTGSAPFKVKRTGEVYLTKLVIQKENNSGSGGTYTTEELDLTSNTNRLRGGTLLGWRQDSTTGDTTLYTTYGDLTFNRASLVSGSWTGTTYTAVPDPQGAADAHTSVYLEIEVGGYSVNPNENINAKIYKDNPGVSTNQLTVKSMTLVENVSAKTVTLETGGLTKGSVSIASTYNAGWDYAITQRVVSAASTTDQQIKTLDFDEKWKVTFTIPNSSGVDVTSSYVVKGPSDPYTPVTLTLQGSAISGTSYHTIPTGGTEYYTAGIAVTKYDRGSKETYYRGNGTRLAQITSTTTVYDKGGNETYYRGNGTRLSGQVTRYQGNGAKFTKYYTGVLYYYDGMVYWTLGNGYWYQASYDAGDTEYGRGTSENAYVPSNSGSNYLRGDSVTVNQATNGRAVKLASSSATVYQSSSTGSDYLRGGTVDVYQATNGASITPIGSTSLRLEQLSYAYGVGSTVSDTYYTRS